MRTAARCCLTLGRRVRRPELLDVGSDVHGLEEPELGEPPRLAPAEEVGNRPGVGGPGVAVADVGGEKFEKTAARVRAGGRDLGRDQDVGFGEGELIVHDESVTYLSGKSNPIKDVMGWERGSNDRRFDPLLLMQKARNQAWQKRGIICELLHISRPVSELFYRAGRVAHSCEKCQLAELGECRGKLGAHRPPMCGGQGLQLRAWTYSRPALRQRTEITASPASVFCGGDRR